MNFIKVKTGFSQLTDDDLVTHAKFIIDSMTGNTFYPSPVPNLVVMTKGYEDFVKANKAAQNGGSQKKALKNQRRNSLIVLLNSLAVYVEASYQNNFSIMLSSGFHIQKTESHHLQEI